MARLPTPGGDNNVWGGVLNEFLEVAHNTDGTLKSTAVSDATAIQKGVVQLAGDLGGTAASPTVPGLTSKADATDLTTHTSATTSVHGIADTSTLETTTGAQTKVDAHVNDATAAHVSSAISYDNAASDLTSTTVKGAIDELDTAVMQQGTLASRPAAATAGNRALYYATDDNGGTLYRSNGTTWQQVGAPVSQASGAQLASAVLTSSYSNQALGAETQITGMSITVDVGTRPIAIYIDGCAQIGGTGSGTDGVGPILKRNGTNVNGFVVPPPVRAAGAAVLFTVAFRQVDTPAPGSHTYTLHVAAGSAVKYVNFIAGIAGFYPPFRLSAVEL